MMENMNEFERIEFEAWLDRTEPERPYDEDEFPADMYVWDCDFGIEG